MPYSVIKVVNGNYAIHAECSSIEQAKVNYHSLCTALWNDKETLPLVARVEIVDQSLNRIDERSYEEIIKAAPVAEPEE